VKPGRLSGLESPGRRVIGARRDLLTALILSALTFVLVAALTHDHVFFAGNDASRFAQIEALVDQGRPQIDQSRYGWTIDSVVIDGRRYSNKPPLLGILGAAVYLALQVLFGLSFRGSEAWTVYLLTLILVGGSTAWLIARFYLALGRYDGGGGRARILTTIALAAGTILLSFSGTLNNHTIAAAWLFFACHSAWSSHGARAGAWLALAACIDIVPGVVFVPVLAYVVHGAAGRRGLIRYLLALVGGGITFAGANWLTVGSWLPPKMVPGAVDLSAKLIPQHMGQVLGVPVRFLPDTWHYPLRCLFGWHGLFSVSPVLLFGAWGMVRAIRSDSPFPRRWSFALAAGSVTLIAGHVLWIGSLGGWSYGYRYAIPVIPILLYFTPRALENAPIWRFATVLAASAALALIGAYHPWPPGYEPDQDEPSADSLVTNPVAGNLSAWLVEHLPDSGLTGWMGATFISPDERKRDEYLQAFYRSKDDREMVVRHLRQVVGRHPERPEAHRDLAAALAGQGRFHQAIEAYRTALRLAPDVPSTHLALGSALLQTGQHLEALAHFEAAARLAPESAPALDQAARILAAHPDAAVRDGPRALQLARRAAELTGLQDATVMDTLAIAYASLGQFDRAIAISEVVLAALPAEATGWASPEARERQATFRHDVGRRLELYRQGRPYREPA